MSPEEEDKLFRRYGKLHLQKSAVRRKGSLVEKALCGIVFTQDFDEWPGEMIEGPPYRLDGYNPRAICLRCKRSAQFKEAPPSVNNCGRS